MERLLTFTIAMAAAAGCLNAGTIQTEIGGPTGLTSGYITSNGGSVGTWTEKNYDAYLFNGAAEGTTKGSPGTNYNYTYSGTLPNNSIADTSTQTENVVPGGVTFALLNDGCAGTPGGACTGSTKTNNVWAAPTSGSSSSILIPIGIYDVTDLWTMLNNDFGPSGASTDTTIEFDFGGSSTVTNGTKLILNLVNSLNNSSNSGQIATATDCSTVGTGTPACNTYATGTTASSSSNGGITVDTTQIYSMSYNTVSGSNPFTGSAGTVVLDDQGFLFGSTYSTLFLVDVKVTENNGVANQSETALSAITVDSVTTPEPSTIWLGITGLLALGVIGYRRRRVA